MGTEYSQKLLRELIEIKIMRDAGIEAKDASIEQIYAATCLVVKDILAEQWAKNQEKHNIDNDKQVYYLSMEFLPGKALKNNIFNLGIEKELRNVISEIGKDIEDLYQIDPDAGLGNGGLGRLASCYLDAAASCNYAVNGVSICYEYGIFKQKIIDGIQVEEPDHWLDQGEFWLVRKKEETEEVHFGGKLEEVCDSNGNMRVIHRDYQTVLALPLDMLIPGYENGVVNTLRLWQSKSPISIDMKLFAEGKYLESMEKKHRAEIISKILYPEDAHMEGKQLRIMQQYFFISATMQYLTKKHFKNYNTMKNFHEKVAFHINDTHPAIAILELMRILIDEYNLSWQESWDIVTKTVSYTNHTIMPEALECWPEELFKKILPRIHSILMEINRRFNDELFKNYNNEDSMKRDMAIVIDGNVKMANLCVLAAKKVNGVSSLHSSIIKEQIFKGFDMMTPDKFTNVTNGIAYRRWLCQANPLLDNFIQELIGKGYKHNAVELNSLEKYKDDKNVILELANIKYQNKVRLGEYIYKHNGILLDPDSLFDVQVKRLHEYKRQLLNLFHIIYLCNKIKENPNLDMIPRTFIFAAKAAPGYYMAKKIISLACSLSDEIEKDSLLRDKIKVVFLENYSVSLSELIMPAAEISEQISLAGKEASGTGNMKLMINGAITLGTEDGANVEIHKAVGDENIFIFGMKDKEALELRKSGKYNPWSYLSNKDIADIIGRLSKGIEGKSFGDITNSLLNGNNADPYFIFADFDSYKNAQQEVENKYKNKEAWNKSSLINIAKSGIFSADRAIKEYCENIWDIGEKK